MIISFVNQKGGVGKTTAAINIGSSLARRNHRLVLMDLDPQGSAVKWQAMEGNQAFDVIHQPGNLISSDVETLTTTYDYVFIDTPPTIDGITWKILAASNTVVIPVSPSPLDLWACTDILNTIKWVQQRHPDVEAKILINRKIPGTRLGREIRDALKEFKTSIFDTELCQRVAFVEAMKYGVSVMQYAPGSKAAHEVEQLCDEIVNGLAKSESIENVDISLISSLSHDESDNILYRDFQIL